MHEDEDERGAKPARPRFERPVLDTWSVAELRHYIGELREEIARAEADIARKDAHRAAADAFFRKG
jgi:uncharacterized small protein (DUF1192 family)